jgi:preprotein translocase subunit SecG
MFAVLTVIIIIASILLVLIVLVQNSKGGGLASNFTGSQVMGVRKTADFLEKATWTLAGVLIFLSITANLVMPRQQDTVQKSVIEDQVKNSVDPNSVPNFPTTAPAKPSQEKEDK